MSPRPLVFPHAFPIAGMAAAQGQGEMNTDLKEGSKGSLMVQENPRPCLVEKL